MTAQEPTDELRPALSWKDALLLIGRQVENYSAEIDRLEKENRGLRSVVTACSKEPMPDWSEKIWDLNSRLDRQKEIIKKLVEAAKAVNKLFGCQNPAEIEEDQWLCCLRCAGCDLEKALSEAEKEVK